MLLLTRDVFRKIITLLCGSKLLKVSNEFIYQTKRILKNECATPYMTIVLNL